MVVLGFDKAPLIIYFSGFLIDQNCTGSVYSSEMMFATFDIRMDYRNQLFVVPSNCLYVKFFVDEKISYSVKGCCKRPFSLNKRIKISLTLVFVLSHFTGMRCWTRSSVNCLISSRWGLTLRSSS